MNLQLFQSRSAYSNKSSIISLEDMIKYYSGNNDYILNTINYSTYENFINHKVITVLTNEEYEEFNKKQNSHYMYYFLKDKKSLKEYIKFGVYNLPKRPLDEYDFINTNVFDDIDTLAKSIDKGLYGLIKSMLPVYTVCYFKKDSSKEKNNINGHSGLIRFDIDHKLTEENISFIKSLSPVAIVPSTSGIHSPIFKIDMDNKVVAKHGSMVKAHELYFEYFSKILSDGGITVDQACRNINRLFYVSENKDFDTFYNKDAKIHVLPKDVNQLNAHRSKKELDYNSLINQSTVEASDVEYIINRELEEIFEACSNSNYQPFYDGSNMYPKLRDFNFSLKNALSQQSLEYWLSKFLTLSKLDKRLIGTEYESRGITYIKTQILTDVENTTANGWRYIFTFKNETLLYISQQQTIARKEVLIDKITKIIDSYPNTKYPRILMKDITLNTDIEVINNLYLFLSGSASFNKSINSAYEVYDFHKGFMKLKINKITECLNINDWSVSLSDNITNEILVTNITQNLQSLKTYKDDKKLSTVKTITYPLKDYFKSGIIKLYNPVEEYFKSLNVYNTDTEIKKVKKLFDDVTLNNGGKYFIDWCFGIVFNSLDSQYYDRILYLYSDKGGDGKTYFIQNDLIPELSEYISTDFSFNVENKDDKFKMTENIILLDDEGTTTSRKSDNAKKSISSKKNVKERKSYDRTKTAAKRIASLVVSLNTNELSSASNYDRRSLVLHFKNKKWKDEDSFISRWRNEIDVKRFWSELYQLYLLNRDYRFVDDDEIISETGNWKMENEATDLIGRYMRVPTGKGPFTIDTHVEVKKNLERFSGEKIHVSLNGYLKARGFDRVIKQKDKNGKFKSGYMVEYVYEQLPISKEERVNNILDTLSKENRKPNKYEMEILKQDNRDDLFEMFKN